MRRHGPVMAHCTDSEDFPCIFIGSLETDFLLVLIELFVGATAEALQANID